MKTDCPDEEVQNRVVCAAIKIHENIILGVRSRDHHMALHIELLEELHKPADEIHGFVDRYGNFLTREEAWVIANAAKQIIKFVSGNELGKLYSANLY